ncbi:MAG TPA: TIGR04211 family SH3 domain-containing protein [Gammaproteobacteria bacterium]|nr:TIGR04211 family SH3 domain-containing protein [Gammaproteobacteria bacterium]
MLNRTLLIVALLAWPALPRAETAYVTDILRLGLHRAEDTSDQPFRNLVSGTELEVLSQTTNYARVRTADGQEGWVKSAYLVSDKPAQLRVAELEAELGLLRAEREGAEQARLAAEQQLAQATQHVDAVAASSDAVEVTLRRLKDENGALVEQLDAYRGSIPVLWVLGALVVTLVAGFAAGFAWIDYTSRRRHGGFRVY